MSNNFTNDLKFGQKYEILLTKLIQNEGYEQCNNKDYDIKMVEQDRTIFYEVKTDRLTHKTGNICIEFECYGKASGITTTKADRYAYFELNPDGTQQLYIIPVKSILKRIKKKLYKRILNGGDFNMSKFYLFDKNIFKKIQI